jgi:hypothetical protein
MIYKLTKKVKKNTEVIWLEINGSLLKKKKGKLGKPFSSQSTKNCGNPEKALVELKKYISEYEADGFITGTEEISMFEFEVFDKAKWHYESDFPQELNSINAYTHTGFYLGWLIINNLISDEFKTEHFQEVTDYLDKKVDSIAIYLNQLDGVFTSNEVNELGYKFTNHYFDFKNGQYLHDYENNLCSNLPSIYHVKNNCENFQIVCDFLDFRFKEFKTKS